MDLRADIRLPSATSCGVRRVCDHRLAPHLCLRGVGDEALVVRLVVHVGELLARRDAIGLYDASTVTIQAQSAARVLIIDVPVVLA
jgi:hypothetical protein